MKFFSFGITVHLLLFGAFSFGQKSIKESLRDIELVVTSSKLDSVSTKIESNLKLDSKPLLFLSILDELKDFVTIQKQNKNAVFEFDIQSFMENKLTLIEVATIDFNEEEELIFGSFTKVLKWSKAMKTVTLYEDFIVNNYKEQSKINNLLIVLHYIKQFRIYLSNLNPNEASIFNCVNEEMESYNAINWTVLAMHPEALLFWTLASCTWENQIKNENK
jgi:hypothetical protein